MHDAPSVEGAQVLSKSPRLELEEQPPESITAAKGLRFLEMFEAGEKPSVFLMRNNTKPYCDLDLQDRELGKLMRDNMDVKFETMGAMNAREMHDYFSGYSPTCVHYMGPTKMIGDGGKTTHIIDNDAWRRMLGVTGCRFIFLNSCQSFELAKELHKLDTVWVVIATSDQVHYKDAIEFARSVWINLLARKRTFSDSMEMAKIFLPEAKRDQCYRIYCKRPKALEK